MKKLLVALVSVLAFAVMVCAQGAAAPAPAAAPEKAAKKAAVKMESCTGVVVSVDTAAKSIVVKDEKSGTDMTFTVAKAKAIAKLKADQTVTVKYKEGTTEAVSITAKKAAKAAKAAKPAAEPAAAPAPAPAAK